MGWGGEGEFAVVKEGGGIYLVVLTMMVDVVVTPKITFHSIPGEIHEIVA